MGKPQLAGNSCHTLMQRYTGLHSLHAATLFLNLYKKHSHLQVNFCCELCLRLGWPLHQWECSVLEFTDSSDIGHMATLAYRLVAGQSYNYLINNLEKFDSEDASYKEGDYLAAFKQESNMEPRPSGDHLKRCVMGLILAR